MKKFIRTLSLMLVLVMTVSAFAACSKKDGEGDDAANAAPFDNMAIADVLAAVTNGVNIEFGTMAEPLNAENFEYFAFTPWVEGYEAICGDAMIGSIAHSLVLFKVPEGTDTAALVTEIESKADPRKWMCVEAEKVIVETRGNVILLVMSFTDIADSIAANFKNYTGAEAAAE